MVDQTGKQGTPSPSRSQSPKPELPGEREPKHVTVSDSTAERRLRTKIDLHIIPMIMLLYLMHFIDRTNIGNAKIARMDVDLSMIGYDYNMILSAFYIGYIVFELPAVAYYKAIGPGWFLPATAFLFGVCSIATAFIKTVPQACAIRFLLGVFEAGMLPGSALYLSRWYRRAELTFRISLYIVIVGELFHSTRLRTASTQARIKNTVDLAFHINTVHDSQVNLCSGRSVRIISIVGMVFIPFGPVSSIFGMHFFSALGEPPSNQGSASMLIDVNPDFWILWAITVPVTFVILGIWRATEKSVLESPRGGARRSFLGWSGLAGRRRTSKKRDTALGLADIVV